MLSQSAQRWVRRALTWNLTAAEALMLVRTDPHPVALIGTWADGSDVIAADPVVVRSPPQAVGDVLNSTWPLGDPPCADPDAPAFGGGWIGYLGYGHAGEVMPVPPAPGEGRRLPAWWFGYYDHVLRRDRAAGAWFFEALWTPDRADALDRRFSELSRRFSELSRRFGEMSGRPGGALIQPRGYSCADFRLVPSAAEHKAAVTQAVEYIRQGDIFQANICLRLEAEFAGDPLDAFCHAVTRLQSPFAAFLRLPEGAVASLSPELFLRRKGAAVLSRPIKGTHRRSERAQQAAFQRGELERSAKNRAENVMIVDLMRNDLSRVCVPGSVKVPRLVHAEAHPGVWHLVSDVRGTLNAGCSDGDLIRATFPPGSVTGAPKVRAMEIIHELEATPREVYTGAIGYRSPLAGLELNVAIRTFEFRGDRVWLGSGGGIVADSVAGDEYRECLLKAGPLIHALGGRLPAQDDGGQPRAAAAARPAARPSMRPSVRPSMRPRPAAGVFTSLLITGGATQGLAGHLARLEGSTRELFGKPLPPSLCDDLAAAIGERPSGRLRITARPGGGPLQATAEVVPLDRRPAVADLRPVVIPGGLGGHKWADRRLLADLASSPEPRPDEHLLIEDTNGDALETDRANVFAVIGGVLCTPPADGRLLPGETRAAVLRAAELDGIGVSVAPMTTTRLLTASEVFVTNAVHGIVPVRSITSNPVTWEPGPVAGRLAAAVASRPVRTTWVGRGCRSDDSRYPPTPFSTAWPTSRGAPPTGQAPERRPAGPAQPTVVLIDNYDSFTYNLAHLLIACGCRVEVVRNDEVPAEQVAASGPAGVLISPGPGAPSGAGISIDVVRACCATTPLLGICLGHQAIAAAFGAEIIRAPQPVHGKPSPIIHDGRGVFSGLPQRFQATRYHSLQVDESSLPPFLAVTARTLGSLPMALRHASRPIEGVQFHPESILTTGGEKIIRNFVQAIRRQPASTFMQNECGSDQPGHRQRSPLPGRPPRAVPVQDQRAAPGNARCDRGAALRAGSSPPSRHSWPTRRSLR